jgi:hypothetical protein
MIHSSRVIALVLVSSASILLGYRAFEKPSDDGPDDWGNAPTTRSTSSGYHGYSHYYYGHRTGTGTGFFSSGSSGSHSSHGTSHGGFGGTGHAVGS